MTDSAPQPTTIEELEWAVWPSFALVAGIRLDLFGRFHGTYPPNINEGTHLISVKGPTQFQVVPFVF